MVNAGKIRPILQYGSSGGIMNMPIRIRRDSRGGTKIEVNPGNGPKNHRESMRHGSLQQIEDINQI